ncbi:MAG: hypothetical protein C4521_09590 [Actinobacteria bacterium]|nr:MAG: hypothetical protein C4521_09590 [Actinomycetota bacterium]
MRKRRSIVLALLALGMLLAFSVAVSDAAPIPTACADCHSKYPGDSFDGYSDATPVTGATCIYCHKLRHGTGVTETPLGYFVSLESVNFTNQTTIDTIHNAHRDTNPYPDDYGCIDCHEGTACTTCHTSAVPHGEHPVLQDGGNAYPGVTERYSLGRYSPSPPYWTTATLTCTNGDCHATMNTAFVARPSCTNCHTVDKTGHGDIPSKHETTSTAGCVDSGCHYSQNLITEHESRTYTCDTCHNNPDPAREATCDAAVEAEDVRCAACHPSAVSPHHDLHLYAAFSATCQSEACHSNYLEEEHARRGYDCSVCHSNPDPERAATVEGAIGSGDRSCMACHGALGEMGHYSIHEADPALDDPTQPYGDFCRACHVNNIMQEHPRHRGPDGSFLNCETCHSQTSGPVYEAISGGDTSCDACHDIHGNVVALHESPTTRRGNVIDGLECNECHYSNLASEHDEQGVTCSECHDNPDLTVLAAIDAGRKECPDCHPTYHTGGVLSGTFVLDGGDEYATSTTVVANSNVAGATLMRFRKDGVWSSWEAYAAEKPLMFTSGDGSKTVDAQYRDGADNILQLSDDILLDTTVPAAPSQLSAAEAGGFILLTWTNPADADLEAVRVLRSTVGYAQDPDSGAGQTQVYEGAGTEYLDTGVIVGDTYFYTAFARDKAGNWSSAATAIRTLQIETEWNALSGNISTPVQYGGYVTLRATLKCPSGTLAGRSDVEVWRSADGTNWNRDGNATYNAAGFYEAPRRVYENTRFQFRFPGDNAYVACSSNVYLVSVQAYLSRPVVPFNVRRNAYFTIYGYLKPRHSGYTRLEIYRWYRGGWRFFARRYAGNYSYSSYTKYSYRYRVPYAGTWFIRAVHSDGNHAASYSPTAPFIAR